MQTKRPSFNPLLWRLAFGKKSAPAANRKAKRLSTALLPIFAGLSLLLSLSGCGFQLRGSLDESLTDNNLFVDLQSTKSLENSIYFRSQLQRYLGLYNLTESNASSERIKLRITEIEREDFAATLNINREITAQESRLRVFFDVLNDEGKLIESRQVFDERYISLDPNSPATSEAQTRLIYNEMAQAAAQKVVESLLSFTHEKP